MGMIFTLVLAVTIRIACIDFSKNSENYKKSFFSSRGEHIVHRLLWALRHCWVALGALGLFVGVHGANLGSLWGLLAAADPVKKAKINFLAIFYNFQIFRKSAMNWSQVGAMEKLRARWKSTWKISLIHGFKSIFHWILKIDFSRVL